MEDNGGATDIGGTTGTTDTEGVAGIEGIEGIEGIDCTGGVCWLDSNCCAALTIAFRPSRRGSDRPPCGLLPLGARERSKTSGASLI